MKQLLRNCLLFTFLVILLAYPLDLIISYNLKKSNYAWGEYSIWNDIYDGNINSEIVVYGGSNAWRHIDPQLLEKSFGLSAYNLGIDGHAFWLQYLRHKAFLKFNQKPKHIILTINSRCLQKSEELYNAEQFLPYMLVNKDIINYTSSYRGFTEFDYYLPLVRYVGNKNSVLQSIENSILFPKTIPKRKNGYQGLEQNWNNDFKSAKKKISSFKAEVDPEVFTLFNDFLIECKEKNIKVILVHTPEHIEGQNFVQNRKEVITLFKNLSDKHEIPFLDYSNNIICTKKEYFYNASHLNKRGAELFTNMLIKDLKESRIITQ